MYFLCIISVSRAHQDHPSRLFRKYQTSRLLTWTESHVGNYSLQDRVLPLSYDARTKGNKLLRWNANQNVRQYDAVISVHKRIDYIRLSEHTRAKCYYSHGNISGYRRFWNDEYRRSFNHDSQIMGSISLWMCDIFMALTINEMSSIIYSRFRSKDSNQSLISQEINVLECNYFLNQSNVVDHLLTIWEQWIQSVNDVTINEHSHM